MRRTTFIMGMAITVDIPDCSSEEVFKKAFKRFKQIDERFSPFKEDSELSKYQKNEIDEENLSTEFKKIIAACQKAEAETKGYFSANYSGKYDPSGYVKGWAIAQAAKVIEKAGYKTFCIGAGGDILAKSNSKKIWNIGIQNPGERDKILNRLSISNGAVATSGTYERGVHIINPKTGQPAAKFLSVTVVGPDIIMADVLATAAFAAGNPKLVEEQKNYEVLVVD